MQCVIDCINSTLQTCSCALNVPIHASPISLVQNSLYNLPLLCWLLMQCAIDYMSKLH